MDCTPVAPPTRFVGATDDRSTHFKLCLQPNSELGVSPIRETLCPQEFQRRSHRQSVSCRTIFFRADYLFHQSPRLVGSDDCGFDDGPFFPETPLRRAHGFGCIEELSDSGATGFFSGRERLRNGRQRVSANVATVVGVPATALWLTPAGKFHDVRQPASFQNGLGHIADHNFAGTLLPMAIEYTFWNERYPELLIEFSKRLECRQLPTERDERTRVLENALQETQTSLAQRAVARDATAFVTLSEGRSGIGGFYDMWRRLALWARGDNFQSRHNTMRPDTAVTTSGGLK